MSINSFIWLVSADSVDYEDEELGYSGITIKPAPPRRDPPGVTKSSLHSPQSKSSHQSPSRSNSKDKEPREHVKSESSSSSRAPGKLDRVNSNSRRNPSKSKDKDTKDSSSRRQQDTARGSSSNRNKDTVSQQRTDENVKDSYTKRKTLVLSRNYRKRDALHDDEASTDVDLRFEGLRDVDLRASSPKKSKSTASTSAFIDKYCEKYCITITKSTIEIIIQCHQMEPPFLTPDLDPVKLFYSHNFQSTSEFQSKKYIKKNPQSPIMIVLLNLIRNAYYEHISLRMC